MWSSHRLDCDSRYSIFNGTSWSAEQQFDWTNLGCYWEDGSTWTPSYLVNAGSKLYSSEEDYTGLSALHPDNPHVIYVSSTHDPRDATGAKTTTKHEIYQGITCDNGKSWQWTPITQGSSMDNLRPIVPKWDASHTALLWLRGSYTSAQSYSFQVVGTITGQ